MEKVVMLSELDKMGVGYCSLKACEKNEMGLPISGVDLWREILSLPIDTIRDMYDYYKGLK